VKPWAKALTVVAVGPMSVLVESRPSAPVGPRFPKTTVPAIAAGPPQTSAVSAPTTTRADTNVFEDEANVRETIGDLGAWATARIRRRSPPRPTINTFPA